MADRPHVLLLMCDQMQSHRMGFVDGIAQTPYLDSLAREGTHFPNAYTSHGQCTPSRAAMLTGRYPHECGVMVIKGFHGHQNRLRPEYRTTGHALSDAGYRTAHFGKLHVYAELDELGFEDGIVTDHMQVSEQWAADRNLTHVHPQLRNNYYAMEAARDYLRNWEDDGRPLFFTFSTNLPHPPFFHERDFAYGLPAASELPLPRSFYEETFETKPAFQYDHAHDGGHGMHPEQEPDLRKELHEYYTMIGATDNHVGQIMDEFKRLGLWDNTMVIFVSDHGDMMGAHKMRLKGTLPYEELYRVPLIVKPPQGKGPAGHTAHELVSTVSLPATIARAAGLDEPALSRYGDFWDLATAGREEAPPERQRVYFEHYAAYWGLHPFYGIRTHRYKYVKYYGEDDTEELYDLLADPHELTNVADDPACDATRRELEADADQWWRNTDGRDAAYYESDTFRDFVGQSG